MTFQRRLVAMAVWGILLLSVSAFLGRWTQPFELFSQFRLQYAVFVVVLTGLALALRSWGTVVAGVAAFAINAIAIAMVVSGGAPEKPAADGVHVVWANLYRRPEALAALADYARAHQADIVALTEVPAGNETLIRRAFPEFECVVPAPGDGNPFAVAIAARAPCPSHGGDENARFADIAGLRLVAVHARPPWDNARTRERDAAIRAAFSLAAQRPRSVVVGDFNATPWSPVFNRGTAGLRRANCGLPLQTTWKSTNAMQGLTIDQGFVTESVAVGKCTIGPDIGSDHRPLALTVVAQ